MPGLPEELGRLERVFAADVRFLQQQKAELHAQAKERVRKRLQNLRRTFKSIRTEENKPSTEGEVLIFASIRPAAWLSIRALWCSL